MEKPLICRFSGTFKAGSKPLFCFIIQGIGI